MDTIVREQTAVLKRGYVGARITDYVQLLKFRLSFLVVFSALVTYLTASQGAVNWFEFAMLALGGFLVTGSSNGINQIIEKDYDKLMVRTSKRPVATGRLGVWEAALICLVMGVSGVFIIGKYLNQLSGLLALISLVLYAFVYTPMKRVSPISVFVGAFPGAIPAMLGWVAFTGKLDLPAIIFFTVQFFWQFPHFWSIAWVLDEDYKRAGFRMLPSTAGRGRLTALQTLAFSLVLIPVGMLPTQYGITGITSAIIGIAGGLMLSYFAFRLFRSCETKDAKKLMFASFIYLPLVQLAYLIDKI